MIAADEFRQFAEECLRWARDAKTDEERKAFLDMTRAWTQAAARMNGVAAPTSMMPPLGDADREFSQ